jgi:hypothetical protein
MASSAYLRPAAIRLMTKHCPLDMIVFNNGRESWPFVFFVDAGNSLKDDGNEFSTDPNEF